VDPAPSGLERATAGEHRRVRSPARRLPDPSKRGRAAPGSFFPGGGFGVLRGSERYQTATRERETARESSPRLRVGNVDRDEPGHRGRNRTPLAAERLGRGDRFGLREGDAFLRDFDESGNHTELPDVQLS